MFSKPIGDPIAFWTCIRMMQPIRATAVHLLATPYRRHPNTRSIRLPLHRPVTAHGLANFLVVTAPEDALHPEGGLFDLLDSAGPGDEILVDQLYEHKYWGDAHSNPVADPNPRLERLINAARRGARVRLLLDSLFDEPQNSRSNRATAEYIRAIATREHLDIEARLANPTGGGLHAKLVLIRLENNVWSCVGSLNGGEVSHKLNREVVLMTDMPAIHARLAEVFTYDWNNAEK